MSDSPSSAGIPRAKTPNLASLRERDEHLDALKRLASQMAHDFNNFLAPALGYATLIKEEVPPDSTVQKYAISLEAAARRSEGTVDKIMFAVRPQRKFRPAPNDLSVLVAEEIKTWAESLPETSQIKLTQKLSPCPMELDATHWRAVIRELLRNSRLSLATGGPLDITLRVEQLSADRANDLGLADTSVACLTVRDGGYGMNRDVLRHAFEPFFTTRPKGQAMGLGLTLVHGVVRHHGGQVILESEEDGGATATVWIPFLKYNERPRDLVSPAPLPARRVGGSKVLLVDDDPTVTEVVKACLQKAGYDVYVGRDGVEGVKLFKQNAKNIALVISDVAMPNMNGVEMLLEIRKLSPHLPAIMISGDVDTHLASVMTAFGDQPPPLMKKPFTLKNLLATVKEQL